MPKVQVGRVEVGKIERALRVSGESLDRLIQLWAWWTLVHGGFLRCSEVAQLHWEDVHFEWQGGVIAWMQVKLAVSGWKVFKTHTQAVLLRFAPQEAGLCVVKALADLHAWAQIQGRQGLVFRMAVQEVRQIFQRLAERVLQQPAGWFGLHSLWDGAAMDPEKDGLALSEVSMRVFGGQPRICSI
jgi:hypothetical protein